jgi:hypothetical protein
MKHSNKLGVLFMLCMSLSVLIQLATDKDSQIQTELKAPAAPEPQESFPIVVQKSSDVPAELTLQAQAPAGGAVGEQAEQDTVVEGGEDPPVVVEESGGIWDFFLANLSTIILALFALAEVIVRLTPTEKDNSILSFLKRLVDWLLPNMAKGGGTFPKRE